MLHPSLRTFALTAFFVALTACGKKPSATDAANDGNTVVASDGNTTTTPTLTPLSLPAGTQVHYRSNDGTAADVADTFITNNGNATMQRADGTVSSIVVLDPGAFSDLQSNLNAVDASANGQTYADTTVNNCTLETLTWKQNSGAVLTVQVACGTEMPAALQAALVSIRGVAVATGNAF